MVDTQRMLGILQPVRVEALLHAYVLRGGELPEGCYRVRDPNMLSGEMQEILGRATELGQSWECWADGLHAWLYTCELSLPLSCERGAPVLHVNRYGEEGVLADTGDWSSDFTGKWCRVPSSAQTAWG